MPDLSSVIALDCNDSVARARVTRWLDAMRLDWPRHLTLRVVVGTESPFPPDDRDTMTQSAVTIQAGPPSGTVRVGWGDYPAEATIHPTKPEASLWLSPEALAQFDLAERTFLLVVLVFVLRRTGWFHIHAAAVVDPRGRGWLIAGASRSGKSTTTALLATRGWQVATDDITFLVEHEGAVLAHGDRSSIALRHGGRRLLSEVAGGVPSRNQKHAFGIDELGGVPIRDVSPSVIAFCRVGERTGLVRTAPRRTLGAIVTASLWVLFEPAFVDEHLALLTAVASQATCYELTVGPDLFDHPDLLEELAS